MYKVRCCLLLIFLSFEFIALPQETAGVGKPLSFRVPYHRQSAGNFSPGDLILRELAKEVLKEPWQVNLQVHLSVSWSLSGKNDNDTIQMRIHSFRVTGDTMFRNFSLAQVLQPSRMYLALLVANRDDTTSFHEQAFSFDSPGKNPDSAWTFSINDYNSKVDTLLLHTVAFDYTEEDWKRVSERTALIHNYHASLAVLDSLKTLSNHVRFSDKRDLTINYFIINECNVALACINQFGFPKNLSLEKGDPGEFGRKFLEQYRTGRTNTYNFLDQLKTAPQSQFANNKEISGLFLVNRLMSWIKRSQWMDNLQGSLYRDFLDKIFTSEPFPEENNVTERFLLQLFPGGKQDTLKTWFAKSISEEMLSHSRLLTSDRKFSEASILAGCALNFNRMSGNSDTLEFREIQLKTREGMFNSFAGIADGCITTRNYPMADLYLQKAMEFRKNNRNLVVNDTFYREVFSKLFFTRNTDCDQLLEKQFFKEALDCYLEIKNLYSPEVLSWLDGSLNTRIDMARKGLLASTVDRASYALKNNEKLKALDLAEEANILRDSILDKSGAEIAHLDSLEPAMAKIRFDKIYEQAWSALDRRQFSLSLSLFNQAKEISGENGIPMPAEFDSLYKRNVKQFLLIQLSAAQKRIWNNQFDSAFAVLARMEGNLRENGLTGDRDLDTARIRFERKILEQRCRNLHDSAEIRIIRADRNILLKRYIVAGSLFTEAIALLKTLPECHPDIKSLEDSLKKYDAPGRFQQKISDAGMEIILGNYEKAFGFLTDAAEIYRQKEVRKFISGKFSVPDFIAGRNNPYLTTCALKKSLELKEVGDATEYCKMLREQGADEKELRMYLVQIEKLNSAGIGNEKK